jgi:hypothetical protein
MDKQTRRELANKLARMRIFKRLGAKISSVAGVYSLRDRGILESELNEILSDLDRCDGPKVVARITSEKDKVMMISFYDGAGYQVNIDAARGELQRLN